MAEFLLILHEPPTDRSEVSPEEVQRIVGEYVTWRNRIEGEGRLVAANKLADDGGRVISSGAEEGSVRVIDGPFAESKEVISGYFLIRADDYDQAVEIAKGCPHVIYGSRIELRQIEETH